MHCFNVSRPMRVSRAAAAIFLACCVAASATGQPFTAYEAPHTSIRLLTGGKDEAGGEPRLVAAIEIRLEPGWKTYWRSPGEGIAPSFSWDESANLKAAQVLWPAPVRFADGGEETSVGYKEKVMLPVLVTPENPAKPVSLNLDVAYGVCKDICMQVEAQLSLDLDAPVRKADREQLLAAMGRVPLKQGEAGAACPHRFVSARLVESGGQSALRVETAFDAGAEKRDVMVELPAEAGLGAPALEGQGAGGRSAYLFPLAPEGAALARSKPMTFTTVSEQGSCESRASVE